MSIGKDAMKRVENNGYSKVNSSAPDMENSEIAQSPEAEKVKVRRGRKPAKKAEEPKTKTVAVRETKALKPEKTENAKAAKSGFERVEIGMEMPDWLL